MLLINTGDSDKNTLWENEAHSISQKENIHVYLYKGLSVTCIPQYSLGALV
jgi:hypothetical protein